MWLLFAIVAAAAWAYGTRKVDVNATVSVDELGVKIATVKKTPDDSRVIYTDTVDSVPGDGNTMDGG
jgi:hypothetical protein